MLGIDAMEFGARFRIIVVGRAGSKEVVVRNSSLVVLRVRHW